MNLLRAWVDEAAAFLFRRDPEPVLTFPMLPMSPQAEKAIQEALAGISADLWSKEMAKITEIKAPPWSTATSEQILADIQKYAALARDAAPIRFYDMDRQARIIPMAQRYAEGALIASLNSKPFRITDV